MFAYRHTPMGIFSIQAKGSVQIGGKASVTTSKPPASSPAPAPAPQTKPAPPLLMLGPRVVGVNPVATSVNVRPPLPAPPKFRPPLPAPPKVRPPLPEPPAKPSGGAQQDGPSSAESDTAVETPPAEESHAKLYLLGGLGVLALVVGYFALKKKG